MHFKTLLNLLNEDGKIAPKTGSTLSKERAKSNAPDNRAKDAARKRAERAKQIPRERQSKEQLIKQVYIVKTNSGKVQLIFKDSFNPDLHTKVTDKEVTMSDANQVVSDPKFEQTRASVLIFGHKKEEKKKPQEGRASGTKEKEDKKTSEKEAESKGTKPKAEEQKKTTPKKAKKMSKNDMFDAMSQMTPEQLLSVPLDVRQEYFKSKRIIVPNRDFDNVSESFEDLTVKFGINTASTLPYNQQVLNAFMLLAKIKSGASDQELQTYATLSASALEFGKSAFNQAKKLLSQIGDECIQNLLSNIETNQRSVDSAGSSDMQCGNYRFKISAGGELSLSTSAFDQSNKSFRGYLANSLYSAIQNQLANPGDERSAEAFDELKITIDEFGEKLISEKFLSEIKDNPKLIEKLQKTEVFDAEGNSRGFVLDQDGNLNPYASLENYQNKINKHSKRIITGAKTNKASLMQDVSKSLLKTVLRGDNLVLPEVAPTHVITANGVFGLNDEYIDEISKTTELSMKPSKELISSENISKYRPAAAALLKNYRTIVEEKEDNKKIKEDNIFINKSDIDPIKMITMDLIKKNDFTFNASLLPGFSPKDLNTVEYNYVRIGNKTIKIPVVNDETPTITQLMAENYVWINDVLIESMSNNFILSNLEKIGLINLPEKIILSNGLVNLVESEEVADINLIKIFENVLARYAENPELLIEFYNSTYGPLSEEYVRDYKKEYRNYHGKSKQRKERAARTRARELMKKKGIVKKGDGKDIDHKKPLRSGGSNGINNLRVRSKSKNRADNGHKKGEKQNKDWK